MPDPTALLNEDLVKSKDFAKLVAHGGGITGLSANLYHCPDDRLTIAVLANAKARDDGAAPVDPLARRITEAYFTDADRRPASR
jgi:hypothetical protein